MAHRSRPYWPGSRRTRQGALTLRRPAKGGRVGTVPPPSGRVPKLFVRVLTPTDMMNETALRRKTAGVFVRLRFSVAQHDVSTTIALRLG